MILDIWLLLYHIPGKQKSKSYHACTRFLGSGYGYVALAFKFGGWGGRGIEIAGLFKFHFGGKLQCINSFQRIFLGGCSFNLATAI